MQIIMTAASVTIKTKGNWPFILSKSELPVICSKLPGFAEQYYAHFRIFHMYFLCFIRKCFLYLMTL